MLCCIFEIIDLLLLNTIEVFRRTAVNGSIKITDVAGNVEYETKAKGGMATWDGNNFSGKRAHTGVYLVFATDDKGDNTCVTKLFLVN